MTCLYEPLKKNMTLKLSVNVRALFVNFPQYTRNTEALEHARGKTFYFDEIIFSFSGILPLGGWSGVCIHGTQHN